MNQIQFETNGLTVLACRVPESYDFRCIELGLMIGTHKHEEGWTEKYYVDLPDGKWKLHIITNWVSETEAKVYVRKHYKWYLDYQSDSGLFKSARESFYSLLRSHGIDPAEKWLLLVCE